MRVPPTCRLYASPTALCLSLPFGWSHGVFQHHKPQYACDLRRSENIPAWMCKRVGRAAERAAWVGPSGAHHACAVQTYNPVRTPDGLRSPVQSRRALLVSSCQLVRVRASTIECPSMTAVCAIRDDPKIARFHVSPRGARKRSKKLGREANTLKAGGATQWGGGPSQSGWG